jgi:hypothetical protein
MPREMLMAVVSDGFRSTDPSGEDLERDVLARWALRFDGWAFRRHWGDDLCLAAISDWVHFLRPPNGPDEQACVLFMLQRWLMKWGGEMLPSHHVEWRAFRLMFLMCASAGVPVVWRHPEWYAAWRSFAKGRESELIAVVARAHANTDYRVPAVCPRRLSDELVEEYLRYDAEWYILHDVRWAWHLRGWLDATEFFSIVNWKARRANTYVAKRLLKHGKTHDLKDAVRRLTSAVHCAQPLERLRILMEDWGLRLPMASAILTVYDADEYTVYDVRVTSQLGQYVGLADRPWSPQLAEAYQSFVRAVRQAVPGISLRDADRVLFSRSAWSELVQWTARHGGSSGAAEPTS